MESFEIQNIIKVFIFLTEQCDTDFAFKEDISECLND